MHLIDHIIKEYDNFESSVSLYSRLMKTLYGNNYKTYVNYLVETGFIKQIEKHSTRNHSSTRYAIVDKFIDITTYNANDYLLIKKLKKYYSSLPQINSKSPVPRDIQIKIIDDLKYIRLDFDKALTYLQNTIDKSSLKYLKNLSMLYKINNQDIFHKFDIFGRFHSNFTNLKKEIRNKYLSIEGQAIDYLDIKSSQPFFLNILLQTDPLVVRNTEVIKYFKILADMNQDIYMYFVTNYPEIFNHPDPKVNRDIAKEYVIKSLFDRKNRMSKYKSLFRKEFPFILDYIENYYKNEGIELWLKLQRMESDFIFNRVYRSIMNKYPHIKIFTVHDSIYFPAEYKDEIKIIWDAHLRQLINKKKRGSG